MKGIRQLDFIGGSQARKHKKDGKRIYGVLPSQYACTQGSAVYAPSPHFEPDHRIIESAGLMPVALLSEIGQQRSAPCSAIESTRWV
jgi:hypothetical protein